MNLDGRRFLLTTVEDRLDLLLLRGSFAKKEFLCLLVEGLDADFLTRSPLPDVEVLGSEITSCLGLFNDEG